MLGLLMIGAAVSLPLSAKTIKYGNGKEQITASKQMSTIEVDIAEFTNLRVSNAITVVYTQGAPSGKAYVTAPSNVVEYVNVRNAGNTLKIGMKSNTPSIQTNNGFSITVKVSSRQLYGVDCTGASGFTADALDASKADIECSGASSIKIGSLTGNDIEFEASGASKIHIERASVAKLELDASGASSIAVDAASCRRIEADASGASSIKLAGKCDSADLEASGASTINARKLQCDNRVIDNSGASSIKI